MTRAAKQKLARQSTAAHPSSQPLFDAFRIGAMRVGEQKSHLAMARDIVQHLQMDRPNETSQNEAERYRRTLDCAVQAWQSAAEIYARVFDSLAKITAGDASQARQEKHGHVEFSTMARTANEALNQARSFALHQGNSAPAPKVTVEEESDEQSGSDSSDNRDGSDSSESAQSEKPQQTNQAPHSEPKDSNSSKSNGKIRFDRKGHKVLWDTGAEKPNVPYSTMGASERKAWRAEKSKQKREKKRIKRAEERGKTNGAYEDTSKSEFQRDYISFSGVPAMAETIVPRVEYEDVSAEVEARIRAKEERKAAAKKEKKRKRESGESVDFAQLNGESKKKSKTKNGAVASDGITQERKKRHSLETSDHASHKRRKTSAD